MAFDYGKYFGEMRVLHDLMTAPDERRWRLTAPEREPEPHAIVLYLGCNVMRTSHMIRTVTALFDHLGLDYVAVGGVAYCCGIVHHRNGDVAAAEGMSHHTVELFKRYRPDEVVMWCPSCIHFYDDVLQQRLPFRVRHTTEFLVDQLPRLAFRRGEARVALHRHVVGDARQREGAACRRLLEALPGVEYVEIEPTREFDRSCGPAVPQALGVERWTALARDELVRAAAAGATTMATIYHGCQRMTCHLEEEQPLTIEHYLSVVARGLGIEFEDTYKKYRLWKDPDRVLADMTPCQQASGVAPARAREVVGRIFPA